MCRFLKLNTVKTVPCVRGMTIALKYIAKIFEVNKL